jgi:glucosamine-phosphate N-acetyltransferase
VGKLLLAALTDLARQRGCYKVILDCSEDNVEFYTKCGFKRKEVQMALYF